MYHLLRNPLRSSLPALFAILPLAVSLGAEEPKQSPPARNADVDIARLIEQLGASPLAARLEAEQALLKIGPAALPALSLARKSDEIEVRLRAAATIRQINERRIAEAEIHVLGVYRGGEKTRLVQVRIESADHPVVLVVCARETVHWQVRLAEGVELLKVIASGHFPQKVLGTDAAIQSSSSEGDDAPEIRDKAFYAYRKGGLLYEVMRDRVKELTGKEPSSFQGRYEPEGRPFVIGQAD
jgi:hypothetical protein